MNRQLNKRGNITNFTNFDRTWNMKIIIYYPLSELIKIVVNLHWSISNLCATIQMFAVTNIFNTSIWQECIKLIKSYIATKIFQINAFWAFYSSKHCKKKKKLHGLQKTTLNCLIIFSCYKNFFLSTKPATDGLV